MHHRTKTLLTMLLPAAVVVLIAALVVLLSATEPVAPPQNTAKPGITAAARELRTVPEVSGARRRIVTTRLRDALVRFYERAYIVPVPAAQATASPGPGPLKRIHPMMTSAARTASKRRPEIFETTEDLTVHSGNVVFSGVVTMDGSNPIDALLEVDFKAQATPVGRSAPLASIRHVGTLRLKRHASRWFVDGFDLKLRTKPFLTPSPSPR